MRLVIRSQNGPFPYPPLGPRGSELAGYIPPGVEWKQLNFGQGEEQVRIGGCEWGFYHTPCHGLAVMLHTGEFPAADAFVLAQRIAKLLFGAEPFAIVAEGTADWDTWQNGRTTSCN